MLVKHISNNEFDIFWNKGWDNWAHFQVNGKTLTQTKGIQVPGNIQTFLTNRYCGK